MSWQAVLLMLMFLKIEPYSHLINRMPVLGSIYAESAVHLPVLCLQAVLPCAMQQ